MDATRWFPNGCVASPHHLATAAGQTVLAGGGNAVDASVAANLVLAVVTPYHCGLGGDLLAVVWDGSAQGVTSIGRSPAGASPDAVRAAIEAGHGDADVSLPGTNGMPMRGALPVTVPGAAAGWFHLLERFGTRSFGDLASAALRLAVDGFPVSPHGAEHVRLAAPDLSGQPGWADHFGRMRAGARFVQPELATAIGLLAERGPQEMYAGELGERIVDTLRRHGSQMTLEDFADHRVEEVIPITGRYRDVEVVELPPPTQGVTALTALGVLDAYGALPDDRPAATHLQIEAVRAALSDRQEHLADPDTMRVGVADLLDPDRLWHMAGSIDLDRAAAWPVGRPAPGGTAYLCAADGDGLLVSLIQSNFVGFGSGVVVPGTGIGLHDRGAVFNLDPAHPGAIGPRRRPMHTLIPALALRDGAPWLVFGTMGGDGQAQTHVQLLGELVDRGSDVQHAIDTPRFVVDLGDGSVAVESRMPDAEVAALRARGHDVRVVGAYDHMAGHAHAIEVTDAGYAGGTDPRCEGAVSGL